MAKAKHDWAALVEAHAESGLTQRAFCAKHGLHPVTFCQKRKRLRKPRHEGEAKGARPRTFIEARPASTNAAGRLELSLGVMTLRFEAETSPTYIAALVEALA